MASYDSGGPEDLVVIPSKSVLKKHLKNAYAAVVIPKELTELASHLPKNTAIYRRITGNSTNFLGNN